MGESAGDQGLHNLGLEFDTIEVRLASKESELATMEADHASVVKDLRERLELSNTNEDRLMGQVKRSMAMHKKEVKFLVDGRTEAIFDAKNAVNKTWGDRWQSWQIDFCKTKHKLETEIRRLREPRGSVNEQAVMVAEEAARVLQRKLDVEVEEKEEFKLVADHVTNALNGETIEDLLHRAAVSEEEKHKSWERAGTLLELASDMSDEVDSFAHKVHQRDEAILALKWDLSNSNCLLASTRKERARDGKGDIFHEQGRILFRCRMCSDVSML